MTAIPQQNKEGRFFGGLGSVNWYRFARWMKFASIYVILIALSMVMGFPLFWMAITSVKDQREVFTTFLPETIQFSNYERVWNSMDLPLHIQNSLYVTGLTVLIVVVT
ncbi:hypothetical protein GF348_03125, partial [candidate division KSB3 bacterium]|nr:hypothetical protein [candidate division KSB3 bacterium]